MCGVCVCVCVCVCVDNCFYDHRGSDLLVRLVVREKELRQDAELLKAIILFRCFDTIRTNLYNYLEARASFLNKACWCVLCLESKGEGSAMLGFDS